MSPWQGSRKEAADGWRVWWAWRPVMFRCAKLPGRRVIVLFEPVWRRQIDGRTEYDLID